jgi:pilus assembly protein CpaE
MDRLDETYLSNIMTEYRPGLCVLPSPDYLNGYRAAAPDAMQRILIHLQSMFDYIVIDGGQSKDDAILKAIQMSDTLLPVSVLTLPSLSNTCKLINSLADFGFAAKDRIKCVVNKHARKNEVSLKDAEAGIGRKIFWSVPDDPRTASEAVNRGKPVKAVASGSKIAKSFENMAGRLLMKPVEKPGKKRFWIFGAK